MPGGITTFNRWFDCCESKDEPGPVRFRGNHVEITRVSAVQEVDGLGRQPGGRR